MSEIPPTSPLTRIRERLFPQEFPSDDRGQIRMVVDSLILLLRPSKVPVTTLRWTYTWGLGGLADILLTLLIATGVILLNNYTPSMPQAYLDVLELRSNVWFGELIRNIHHWSANLLIVVAAFHLVRVFAAGAYRPPRELNWLIGLVMLLLVIGANFTGYLLPWHQHHQLHSAHRRGPPADSSWAGWKWARAPCSTSIPCTSPSSRWGWSFWLPITSGASAKMAA